MITPEVLKKETQPAPDLIAQLPCAIDNYLQSDEFNYHGVNYNTKAAYTYDLRDWRRFIYTQLQSGSTLSLEFVTHGYVDNLRERGKKQNTIKRRLVAVTNFFGWAAELRNGLIDEWVLDTIPKIDREKRAANPIDSWTIERLRENANDLRTAAMLEMVLQGARNSQIINTRRADVSEADEEVSIKLTETGKNWYKELKFTGYGKQVLEAYLKTRPDDPNLPLFPKKYSGGKQGSKSLSRQTVRRILKPSLNTTGIASPDDLRMSIRAAKKAKQ